MIEDVYGQEQQRSQKMEQKMGGRATLKSYKTERRTNILRHAF